MIKIINGDIFAQDVEALVNPVNCVGTAGAGLAKQFREKYPANDRKYITACKAGNIVPGRVSFTTRRSYADRVRYIINFPTKTHWKSPSKLEYVRTGLVSLVATVKHLDIKSIAIPALGCGLGGLQWVDVRGLIEEAFRDLPDLDVRLLEPQ